MMLNCKHIKNVHFSVTIIYYYYYYCMMMDLFVFVQEETRASIKLSARMQHR